MDPGTFRIEADKEGGDISLIWVRDDDSGMPPKYAGRAVGQRAEQVRASKFIGVADARHLRYAPTYLSP